MQGLRQGSSSELRTSSVTLLRAASAAQLPAGLTWLTVGDWGRGGESGQRAVAQHMAKWASATASAFIVSTGDNFYPAGLGLFHIHSRRASCRDWRVCYLHDTSLAPSSLSTTRAPAFLPAASAIDPQFRESWSAVYGGGALSTMPWYIVAGNHDWRGSYMPFSSNSASGAAIGGEPSIADSRWHFPALSYVQTFALPNTHAAQPSLGCVRAVYIDTTSLLWPPGDPAAVDFNDEAPLRTHLRPPTQAQQLAWLDAELEKASRECRATVVVGHHPIYVRAPRCPPSSHRRVPLCHAKRIESTSTIVH